MAKALKETKPVIIKVEMFPQQYDAYMDEDHQFIACVGGVQSGKTWLGSHWARKMIYRFPSGDGMIISPTYKILSSSTLRKFFSLFPQFQTYYKEGKSEIVLPTGGVIFCRSADNPEGVSGITCSWIWADEAGQMSDLTWQILRNRVAMTQGKILFTSTPYGLNSWFYNDLYLGWREKKDKNISFYTWKSTDNPMFSKEYFNQERMRLRPETFARIYCGEFSKMVGLVYDVPQDLIIDVKPIEYPEAVICGVDFGFDAPSAITVWALKKGVWFLIDEWKFSHRTNTELLQVIQNKVGEHKISKVYCDNAEPARIEEFRKNNIPVYEVSKDIKGGISHIQTLFRERKIFIFNTCKEFLNEASMYSYPETPEGKESKDLPEKFNDHLMDSMRYALTSYKPLPPTACIATKPLKPYYTEWGI